MTTTYTTRDKTEWGNGPWQNEPDKVSWTDEETGLPCLVVRNHGGALCGYVGVDPNHPWHGVDYSEHIGEPCDNEWCYEHTPDGTVKVHGGLTYSAGCQHNASEDTGVCHIPQPGESDDVWWFGFDTAHDFDLCPAYKVHRDIPVRGEVYRDLPYVQSEVRRLARQLVRVSS